MGRTAARLVFNDRLSGTQSSKRSAAACIHSIVPGYRRPDATVPAGGGCVRRLAGLLVVGPGASLAGAQDADGAPTRRPTSARRWSGTPIIEFLGGPLPAPQHGAWAGHTYTCTYPLAGGQLVLTVDQLRNKGRGEGRVHPPGRRPRRTAPG